jgi:hypothetical protein
MKKQPIDRKFVSRCPFCGADLFISRLSCDGCHTQIESTVTIPPFFRLPPDLQEFVLIFLRYQGKIVDIEKALGVSYPTVCKRLDLVNELLGNGKLPMSRKQVLEQLESGEISVQEATQLLKEK